MKYALLIHEAPGVWETLSGEEQRAVSEEYLAIRSDPRVVGGAQLASADNTSTVRVQDGDTMVTDGPFADTKEAFGGYFLVETDDLDGAIAVAAKIPAARQGGAVEIRPMVAKPQ